MQKELITIPVQSIIEVKENQPRHKVDIKGLAESIRLQGLMNPIMVVRISDTDPQMYRLVDGHRRLAAVRSLEREDIFAIVEPDEQSAHESMQALALNAQREQLSEYEIGQHLQMQLLYVEPEIIAAASGKSIEEVKNYRKGAQAIGKDKIQQTELWQLQFIAENKIDDDEEIETVLNADHRWDSQLEKIVSHHKFLEDLPILKKASEEDNDAPIFESINELNAVYSSNKLISSTAYDNRVLCDHKHAIVFDKWSGYKIYCVEPELHDESSEEVEEINEHKVYLEEVSQVAERVMNRLLKRLDENKYTNEAIVKSPLIDIFLLILKEHYVSFDEINFDANRVNFYEYIKFAIRQYLEESNYCIDYMSYRNTGDSIEDFLTYRFEDQGNLNLVFAFFDLVEAWDLANAEDIAALKEFKSKVEECLTEESEEE